MKKFLILVLLLTSCFSEEKGEFVGDTNLMLNKTRPQKGKNKELVIFKIKIAQSAKDWEEGLMYYKSMPERHVMFFDFGTSSKIRMWMKNTYIPLDMLFYKEDKKVAYIFRNAKPEDLTTIGPTFNVRYVLEINAGEVEKLGIKIGDTLEGI
jgi:uncharacterized membrane protein (UPF0127 family)